MKFVGITKLYADLSKVRCTLLTEEGREYTLTVPLHKSDNDELSVKVNSALDDFAIKLTNIINKEG